MAARVAHLSCGQYRSDDEAIAGEAERRHRERGHRYRQRIDDAGAAAGAAAGAGGGAVSVREIHSRLKIALGCGNLAVFLRTLFVVGISKFDRHGVHFLW